MRNGKAICWVTPGFQLDESKMDVIFLIYTIFTVNRGGGGFFKTGLRRGK